MYSHIYLHKIFRSLFADMQNVYDHIQSKYEPDQFNSFAYKGYVIYKNPISYDQNLFCPVNILKEESSKIVDLDPKLYTEGDNWIDMCNEYLLVSSAINYLSHRCKCEVFRLRYEGYNPTKNDVMYYLIPDTLHNELNIKPANKDITHDFTKKVIDKFRNSNKEHIEVIKLRTLKNIIEQV